MSAAENWNSSEYGAQSAAAESEQKPEQWYRDNAAVFFALEEWQRRWDDHARMYEDKNGRPPSSMNREKNRAAFKHTLVDKYGRGEPDPEWVDERAARLEKRGAAPERFGR